MSQSEKPLVVYVGPGMCVPERTGGYGFVVDPDREYLLVGSREGGGSHHWDSIGFDQLRRLPLEQRRNISFVLGDGTNLPLPGVVVSEVHFYNVFGDPDVEEAYGRGQASLFLGEAKRVLRPGGVAYVGETITPDVAFRSDLYSVLARRDFESRFLMNNAVNPLSKGDVGTLMKLKGRMFPHKAPRIDKHSFLLKLTKPRA